MCVVRAQVEERFFIRPIANRMEKMAARIHAVQIAAYRQEASRLDIRKFPPLERAVRDVMASPDAFFGALAGERLLGVISLEQRSENEVFISSLTVSRSHAPAPGVGALAL
jgi:hypothetical protein